MSEVNTSIFILTVDTTRYLERLRAYLDTLSEDYSAPDNKSEDMLLLIWYMYLQAKI